MNIAFSTLLVVIFFTSPCLHAASAEFESQSEIVIGPDYKDALETKANPKVKKGEIVNFTMKSTDSEIYPGIAKNKPGVVPYERKVSVYVSIGKLDYARSHVICEKW